MLLASHVVIFILGFIAAVIKARRAKKAQPNHSNLVNQFQAVASCLKSGSSISAIKDVLFRHSSPRHVSHDCNNTNLLTKEEIETHFEISSWQRLAYEDFKATILAKDNESKTFPCIYATMGYRSNEHRYIFLESDDASEPRNLRLIAPAIKQYLDISKSLGPNTSLVIIGGPSDTLKSVDYYHDRFWDMLRGLRIVDPRPWPSDIPQDTASEKWAFCFDGQPLFPILLTPAHRHRWSRHMSVPVTAMQPKWVLDNLLGTPEKRDAATSKVRKLLAEYDQIGVSPDLTSYGQPGTSEVRQLCLMDENETAKCPYEDFDR